MNARGVPATGPGKKATSLSLEMPVRFLKGVGDRRAAALDRLGIHTAGDLIFHVPRRYEDASTITAIVAVRPGDDVTILGRVISKGVLPTRRGLRIFQAVLRDDSDLIEVSWPGQPFLDRSIEKGDVLLVTGRCRFYRGRQLQAREWVNLGRDDAGSAAGRVLAIYPATEGLGVRQIRALLEMHLEALLPLVEDYLPDAVRRGAGLPPLVEALRKVHRPGSLAEAEEGRARLAFDELFFLHLLHQRALDLAREPRAGIVFLSRRTLTTRLKETLPFQLTRAQVRAIREIVADMCAPRRMQRLLQGDVGSGKTVVALFAALLALENGYQAALMAPTELLAEQHFRSIGRLLEPLGIQPLLLTGSLAPARRREVEQRLASGEPLLVVGTHALVQERTRLARLGLAIVDEQHRFGVEQRAALGEKGERPDVLLMSATPIPRSLALTLYGDLDVSVLDELPPGRQPVTTVIRPASARQRVLAFLDREVSRGRQGYIVYPIIEESDKLALRAATSMYEELSRGVLGRYRLALLHGRLPAEERDRIMRSFRDGEVNILVATTVIEVGIDVPNATVMVIEHPERFGLSQLHQLRGRVGRGAEESYCILLASEEHPAEAGVSWAANTRERLEVFASTQDGFEIARADLRLRGMGDLFGERQHGYPMFRVADPLRDEALNIAARSAAAELIARDPELLQPEHGLLRKVLRERYARALELFRVG
jgi:ATP-dependent DNA helicase RecG